jgi:hypothetical protein
VDEAGVPDDDDDFGFPDDDDEGDYPAPGSGSGPDIGKILLISAIAAWGLILAGFAGTGAYLYFDADSIMQEVRDSRPQVTIKVRAKRLVRRKRRPPAETPAETTPEGAPGGTGETKPEQTAAATPKTAESGEKPAEGAAPSATPAGKSAALHPHPDPELIEKDEVGPLPIIDKNGRLPWRVYARPFNVLDKRPKIAIVLTWLGVSSSATKKAIQELPGAITLAFAPFSRGLPEWIELARGRGHEVLVNLPMEPLDYPRSDPGPYALLTTLPADQNLRRLKWVLSRMTGYIGVANFMGSKFTADEEALGPVMADLKKRGLMIFDSSDPKYSIVKKLATKVGVPYALGLLALDREPNRGYIDKRLKALEGLAAKRGKIVAVARPYPIVLARIKRWVKKLEGKNVVLVPVSAVTKRPSTS